MLDKYTSTYTAAQIAQKLGQINTIASNIQNVSNALGGVSIWSGTKDAYEAMATHDSVTLYIATDSGSAEMYLGDTKIATSGGGEGYIYSKGLVSFATFSIIGNATMEEI